MQFSNTKEDGLETIIVDWLVKHNGYEQGTNMLYRILVLNTKIINLQFLSMRLIPVKTGVTLHK